MCEFVVSKQVLGIVEFDKVHQLWRVCGLDKQIFDYKDVKKVSVVEVFQKGKTVKTVLNNIAASTAGIVLATPSSYAKFKIKVLFFDGSDVVFDISKDYLQVNILEYHEDKRKAQKVKKVLQILEKRNKESK